MNLIDYRKKLGIGFDDAKVKEIFLIIGFLENSPCMENQMTKQEYSYFCFQIGQKPYSNIISGEIWNNIIYLFKSNMQSIKDFLSYVNSQKNDDT